MRELAYQHMHVLITTGRLKAGSVVSELLLAKDLGSSRTPIREAIGQLVAEGLLEQTSTGTTLVVQLQRQDVIELYELREALEVYAIGKVANASVHLLDRERLETFVDEILVLHKELEASAERALSAEQMNRFLTADLSFHSMLMSMAHNTRIQKVVNEMRLLIRIFSIHRSGHELPQLGKIYEQHRQILEAVLQQRPEAAKHVLSEHIRTSLKERLDEFDRWRREQSFFESVPNFAGKGKTG